MEVDKAPGLDGFTIAFFHACWSIVKKLGLLEIRDFRYQLDRKRLQDPGESSCEKIGILS
jgi:hypothetical protein